MMIEEGDNYTDDLYRGGGAGPTISTVRIYKLSFQDYKPSHKIAT